MNIQSIILETGPEGGSYQMIIMFALMFVVFYFFMIRPQMRKQKQEKKFQEELKKGDWVVTTAGIHGKVSEMNNGVITLETGAGKIRFEQTAISREATSSRYGKEEKK